jgi:hypothetical protein
VLLLAAVLVLHYIPIRVLLLAWGIIKFSKRLVRPHTVSNNEVLDLLSRVPDDEELVSFFDPFFLKFLTKITFKQQLMYRELASQQQQEQTRQNPKKKKQT